MWAGRERFTNLNKFDDVQPSLSALIFGNKRLGSTKPQGYLRLGETDLLPSFHKRILKKLIPVC